MQQVVFVYHNAPCGEIRAFDIGHHFRCGNIWIFHIGFHDLNHFKEVMGRDTGSHAYSNPFCSVDQKVGDLYREHGGLLFCLIKVRDEIHYIFVKVCKVGFLGDLLQARFCVTHGGCAVAFHGTKIAMAIH